MRGFVYAIAVVAALGIGYYIAQLPVETPAATSSAAAEQTLVFHIPEMHCPHGCFPTVQQTLANQQQVKHVALIPQKEEDVIDNPRVTLTVAAGFDANAAIEALAKAGFQGSSVEQPN